MTIVTKQLQHLLLFTAIIAYVLFSHSCANPGTGPGGGLKDTIPPVILNMVPAPYSTKVTQKEITITFDEYIIQDNLATKMVVSPPLAEKPSINLKGKTIHIKFNEDLIPNRTYSVDLKDGIKDYNEGNKIESIRMLFSTYESIDTLRIKGYLLDAFTLNPIKDAYATLYTLYDDSIFTTLRPDFIAKTDEKGFFLFDNLPSGNYKLYGLTDIDNNLMYTLPTEQIAFIDSFIVPGAEYVISNDTIFEDNDTLVSTGYTNYWPEPVYAFLFEELKYNQFITSSQRETPELLLISFNESLTDSFKTKLINVEPTADWNYTEYSKLRDSISIWLTDTLLIHNDSLLLEVNYTSVDTLGQYVTQIDTLKMYFSHKETKTKSKKKEEEKPNEKTFTFTSNLTSNNFDLNKAILLEAPSPLEKLDTSMIQLMLVVNDSVSERVAYQMEPLPDSQRKYQISYEPLEARKYTLKIDSAVVKTKAGITNLAFESAFKTQKADYYGTAVFELSGITSPSKLQLLQNSDKEGVVKEMIVQPEQKTATFDYLKPNKYRVKLIVDQNNNGKWDTGNLSEQKQPEPVFYFSKVINIKSNWELKESWPIPSTLQELKDIKDDDKKKDKE
ncbi:MAG: Ig-like domain-containing protein [Prolixibacteraceae bacterium]